MEWHFELKFPDQDWAILPRVKIYQYIQYLDKLIETTYSTAESILRLDEKKGKDYYWDLRNYKESMMIIIRKIEIYSKDKCLEIQKIFEEEKIMKKDLFSLISLEKKDLKILEKHSYDEAKKFYNEEKVAFKSIIKKLKKLEFEDKAVIALLIPSWEYLEEQRSACRDAIALTKGEETKEGKLGSKLHIEKAKDILDGFEVLRGILTKQQSIFYRLRLNIQRIYNDIHKEEKIAWN